MQFVAVLKRECETCQLVAPVLAELKARLPLTVYSQDDPAFPEATRGALDDRSLEHSWRHRIEVVPTLLRLEDGREVTVTFAGRTIEASDGYYWPDKQYLGRGEWVKRMSRGRRDLPTW